MIELDGDYGEGGGQIIRNALSLSCLTGRPFKINNIRKGRGIPGLKRQHLACVNALKELVGAVVEGDFLGSTELSFSPGKKEPGNISVDIGTAGAITLFLQSLLPFLVFQKKRVKVNVKGGTDVQWSMPYDYFANILVPQLRRFADIGCRLLRRGYFPDGGGEVELIVRPHCFKEIIMLERSGMAQVKGIASASSVLETKEVCERMADSAGHALSSLGVPVNISRQYGLSFSAGCCITLWAVFDSDVFPVAVGADVLGSAGKKPEDVGKECAEKLLAELSSGAPIDCHLADNLIPFLGVAGGAVKASSVSKHTLSAIYVAEKFLDVKFEVKDNIIRVLRA
jgi:RNA 3'-terminal phosphate cyclase (ATP)